MAMPETVSYTHLDVYKRQSPRICLSLRRLGKIYAGPVHCSRRGADSTKLPAGYARESPPIGYSTRPAINLPPRFYLENEVNQSNRRQAGAILAVSYTHLDVYKRQIYTLSVPDALLFYL